MIPLQLTIKNFLSYREATLDFRGLHVACICGANGAGKSSLLEAITWVVWGQSRAQTEDDVLHQGSTEASVDFMFQCHQHTYRIIRTRHRGQASTLEFQVQTPSGFRSLTEKGLRATQQRILQHLKLDYDTFINSAYLRQGRADEFMLKRPTERKQILADLLKLDQYDVLAERSKEQSRQLKAECTVLERTLETMTAQLQQREALAAEQQRLSARRQELQQQQDADATQLRRLQAQQQQRQTGLQQLALQRQQQQHLAQDCQRLQAELQAAQQQQQQLMAVLQEAETIASHYAHLQQLQRQEEIQSTAFQAYQALQARCQQQQQQLAIHTETLKDRLRQTQAQLELVQQQQQELQRVLLKRDEIESAAEQLRQARQRLIEFDQLQMQAAPLLQRRQQVQSQIDRAQARILARLEELQSLRQQLETQQQGQSHLQQAVQTVANQIEYLEKRRFYQQQVREKGVERRAFLERLQEQQRECERGLAELEHKMLMLQAGNGSGNRSDRWEQQEGARVALQSVQPSLLATAAYPPCPLCNRPLDEQHWQLVLERHQTEQEELRRQLWVIREQLTTSDREIRVLRQEYRELEKELAQYGDVLEQRGKLQEQWQGSLQAQSRLQQLMTEQATLERSLQQQDYATDLQQELQLLDRSLQQLNYDDRNHALARGQVDRWRWAEVKQAELRQAQRRWGQLAERQPELEATLADLQQQLATIQASPLAQQLAASTTQLEALGYNAEHHTALRQQLRQAQVWQLRYQELQQAQQCYPQVQQRLCELSDLWVNRTQALETLTAQVNELQAQLEATPDPDAAIQTLEQQLQQRRTQLDDCLNQLGRLQQQQHHLESLSIQSSALTTQLQTVRRQLRVYQELSQAFGKNGIQALMIENILPQFEAETNQILGRLSANQLHIQFVTQRAGRKSTPTAKLIDTLDIYISDLQGTRPYETYSGGEAFRVNFAIRLALARMLAQRSGTALQMLIIDEGFGTQDEAGCDRLIGAINTIASDFACILTVTHMPHLKEAFQTRIEVSKTDEGSQLQLYA
ncbi:MAG: SMC family ATPase [Synechococcales cyanobacterium C42_A2020_086]|nr:SMC family ATPase [Synechococcales cyanobacterium C42_A2020_086]